MTCRSFYYKTKLFEWSRQGISGVLLIRNSVCTTTQIFVSRHINRESASSHFWFMSILRPLFYQLNTLLLLVLTLSRNKLASNCRWALATPNHRRRRVKSLCRAFSSLKAWFKYSFLDDVFHCVQQFLEWDHNCYVLIGKFSSWKRNFCRNYTNRN